MKKTIELPYQPQPKQRLLHETEARLVLYGGAAGGGKSTSLRWDIIGWCLQVPGLDAYLFRRTLPELEANHIRKIKTELPATLGSYNETRKRYEFFNGSGINFCYCEKEDDVARYQGAEIHLLGVDEAAHLTDYQLNYLISRVRLGDFAARVPEKYRALLPRAVFTSNPGGPGHLFLKQKFIDAGPAGVMFTDPELEWPSIFIPARMGDNQYLDRGYEKQFSGLPPELAKALREGDWDAVVGKALHSLSRETHMLRPFVPPRHWTRFMAMDWGTARPFSVGWYCVSEGAVLAAKDGWPERYLPDGAVIRYAEWYGWNGKANQGCRLESPAVAKGILQRETERKDPPMMYRVIDSAAGNRHDGPSVIERMEQTDERLRFRKSEKDRKAGYREFLDRLALTDSGEPMFFCTSDCTHFWRTVPTLVLDDTDPEKGPDTQQEDHVYDEVDYGFLSRPFVTTEKDVYDEELREARRQARKSVDPYATA